VVTDAASFLKAASATAIPAIFLSLQADTAILKQQLQYWISEYPPHRAASSSSAISIHTLEDENNSNMLIAATMSPSLVQEAGATFSKLPKFFFLRSS